MGDLPVFDFDAFVDAYDSKRRERGLDWYEFAAELWSQSAALNARRHENGCPGHDAISRLRSCGETSCQYSLFMLRWLNQPPEDFLIGDVIDVGDTDLPSAGADARLRWDLHELHTALNRERQTRDLTWLTLGHVFACAPSQLTNLRGARFVELDLAMQITQWLALPAARFIHAADW